MGAAPPEQANVRVEVGKISRGPLKFTGVKRSSLLSDSSAMGTRRSLRNTKVEIPPTVFFAAFLRNVASFFATRMNKFSFSDVPDAAAALTCRIIFLVAWQQIPDLCNKRLNNTAVFCHGHM